jgi:hypothetical protein
VLTRVLHWSLTWIRTIQLIPPHYFSLISVQISSYLLRLGLSSGLSPSDFPTKTLYAFIFPPMSVTFPDHMVSFKAGGKLPCKYTNKCRHNLEYCWQVFCYETPCSFVDWHRRFGGTCFPPFMVGVKMEAACSSEMLARINLHGVTSKNRVIATVIAVRASNHIGHRI